MDICPVCGKPHGKDLPNSPPRVDQRKPEPQPEPQPSLEVEVEEVGQIVDSPEEEMEQPAPLGMTLEKMTGKELRAYADAIGVELPRTFISKEKMVKLIKTGGA